MKLFLKLIKQPSSWLLMLIVLTLIGIISANNNFKVGADGKMECVEASITGGAVNIHNGTQGNANLSIESTTTGDFIEVVPNALYIRSDSGLISMQRQGNDFNYGITLENILDPRIFLFGNGYTEIKSSGITTPTLTQTSRVEFKKNIEKLENALEIIKNTDIYKYNLKTEKDVKKHIGFIIGEDYNYSKEISSVKEDGADIYSMVSVCFKAIQEQQEQIEDLKQEIKNLKAGV